MISATKMFEPKVENNSLYRFKLIANPTKKIQAEGKKNGNRVPLIKEQQIEWLKRKLEQCATIEDIYTTYENQLFFYKTRPSKKTYILQVCFEGILHVKNPEILTQIITNGIGSAKGFGCGLLSLSKA